MKKISFKETVRLLKIDLAPYGGGNFLVHLFFTPGYKYTFHHRLCYYFYCHKLLLPLFVIWRLYMYRLTWKFGIQTAWNTSLPEHFVIAHFGGITFLPKECGSHIYLRQNVTVGMAKGTGDLPRLGNHITFGANSIVIGDIKVGDNVTIAAGAVVNKDVPDNCVVAGVPAKVIKFK